MENGFGFVCITILMVCNNTLLHKYTITKASILTSGEGANPSSAHALAYQDLQQHQEVTAFYLNSNFIWLPFPFFRLPCTLVLSNFSWVPMLACSPCFCSKQRWSFSPLLDASFPNALRFLHRPLSGDLQAFEYVPLEWLRSSPSPQCILHHWACEVSWTSAQSFIHHSLLTSRAV